MLAQSAHVPAEILQLLFLGEGYWLAGESDKARQTLEELLELANRCGAKFYLGSAHRLLGEIALTTDPIQVAAPLAAPQSIRPCVLNWGDNYTLQRTIRLMPTRTNYAKYPSGLARSRKAV